jgi:AbrB family looped-hinge helix DNA binding protein
MTTVTLSSKYQIVIPKEIREMFHLQAGQKLVALPWDGRIVLVPVPTAGELQGFVPGIDTNVIREEDRV